MRSPVSTKAVLVAVALAGAVASSAEARGRRGGFSGAHWSMGSSRSATAPRPAFEAEPSHAPATAARPILPVHAPAPVAREARSSEEWCAKRRVVGSGSGFCEIN